MECESLPPPQIWDEAEVEARTQYRQHITYCGSCRSRVLSQAPDQLLFSISDEPLPEDFWFGFWNSIGKKLNVPVAHHASNSYRTIRWAALFLFAALILSYSRDLPESNPVRRVESYKYPVIESIDNPEARYYIFQAGDRQKIVMVYDPDMKL